MRFERSKIEGFKCRYKRLHFEVTDNPTTGGKDWAAYNSLGRKVLKYSGSKSSIFLVNKLYTIESYDKGWVEDKLKEIQAQFGGEIVQG